MKEANLRKWHRYLGITMALFLLLQGGSGLLLSFGELFEHDHAKASNTEYLSDDEDAHEEGEHEHGITGQLHHKEGAVWHVYRIFVGFGLLGMIFTGVPIFMKIRAREKKARRKQP